jgi:hypothetical protein
MNSVVERVARALFDAKPHRHPTGHVPVWNVQPDDIKGVFRRDARAALEALRYVDGVDEQAAIDTSIKVGGIDAVTVIECYDAMISAALRSGEG